MTSAPPENPSAPAIPLGESLRGALKLADRTDRLIRIREIFRTLSVEQLPDAFEQVKKLRPSDRYQILAELGKRWAELDIQGALAFGMQNGGGSSGGYSNFLYGVVNTWASTAPSEAMAWVNALPPGQERNGLLNTMISVIGRDDPRAAVQILQNQGSNWQGFGAVEELFAGWAGREPQAAIAAAAELRGNSGYAALHGAARSWAQENPRAAIAWSETIPKDGVRKYVMDAIVDNWAEADPLSVLAWSKGIQNPEIKRNALSKSISQLADKDLPTALSQIEMLESGEDRDRAVKAAAESVGRRDARSALQLLEQLDPGPERTRAISEMCSVWASSEPRAAVEWLFENSTPSKGGYELTNVLGRWAESAPDEAIAWAQKLPAGEKREAALAGVASSLSFLEPEKAQTLFKQLSPESQAAVAERFTYSLVNQDLTKARTWAESLPPGKAQAAAFFTITYQLANRNVTEAVQWLEKLPSGQSRDRAIMGFSNHAARRDPDAALAWALTISDEVDRTRQVESLFRNWQATDSASARKWLDTNNQLSAAQRRRLQER